MKKILVVAKREFLATVTTKGFLFGILIPPVIILFVSLMILGLVTRTPPRTDGEIVVLTSSEELVVEIRNWLSPGKFTERREAEQRRLKELTPAGGSAVAEVAIGTITKRMVEEIPRIAITALTSADVEKEKDLLKFPVTEQGSSQPSRIAVIVIHDESLRPTTGQEDLGDSYDLFVRNNLDDRLINEIQVAITRALGATRLRLAGFDPALVDALAQLNRSQPLVVTSEEAQKTNMTLLPKIFMVILYFSLFLSANLMLMSTAEEKSNRIVELLLSTVSAMELMTGKILGNMGAGLLPLILYAGLGLVALATFTPGYLVDPLMFVCLVVFFVILNLAVAALMAAIGAAVSDLRDAQSVVPWLSMVYIPVWILMSIARDFPNSLLSMVLSFVPLIGNFVMMVRLSTNTPPPMLQVMLVILVNAAFAYCTLRFAAKVFRIGLLMFGKPPTFGTLIRWVKMSN